MKHIVTAHFGSSRVISRGVVHETHALPGFVAEQGGEKVGLLHYHISDGACEIVTVVSLCIRQGIGRALLNAVVEVARARGCRRVWLVTTNDNTAAQRFYRAVGLKLVAVHRGAITAARRLKPEIPMCSAEGVPITDELEYQLALVG